MDLEVLRALDSYFDAAADVTPVKCNSGIMCGTVFAATGAGLGPIV